MSDTTPAVADPVVGQARVVRQGLLLAVVLVGVFMAILDVAIANVAVPSIGADLPATGAQLQLIVGGYIIAYAVLLITGARLGDLAGRRRMFLLGLAVFTAASLACGLAWSAVALVAFRLVQGAGAALMVPQVLSLIQLYFTGPARARALSIYATVIAGGAIVGQVGGGLLVTADLFGSPWRPVFLVNVPIGLVLLAMGTRGLPRDPVRAAGARPAGRLDLPGLVTLAAAVFAAVLPLVLGHELNWPLWTWLSLAGSAALVAVFVGVERGAAAPLVPGALLRSPGLVAGALGILAAMANYGGILFLLTLFVQRGLGYSALVAGLVFLPSAATFAVASLTWRRLPPSWHRRVVPCGLSLSAAALVGLALTVRAGEITWLLEIWIGCFGAGMGAAFSPLFTAALSRVPAEHAAGASGVLTTVNQLGQVIGVATYGTVFLSLFGTAADAPHAASVTASAMAAGGAFAAVISLALLARPRVAPA